MLVCWDWLNYYCNVVSFSSSVIICKIFWFILHFISFSLLINALVIHNLFRNALFVWFWQIVSKVVYLLSNETRYFVMSVSGRFERSIIIDDYSLSKSKMVPTNVVKVSGGVQRSLGWTVIRGGGGYRFAKSHYHYDQFQLESYTNKIYKRLNEINKWNM